MAKINKKLILARITNDFTWLSYYFFYISNRIILPRLDMPYTLVVIDMQHYFNASRTHKIRRACLREIKQAMDKRLPIMFVEYHSAYEDSNYYGKTIPSLTRAVAGYELATLVVKKQIDGGEKVYDSLVENDFHKNVRLVGVEADVCVYDTASSLTKTYKVPVTLVTDACANHKFTNRGKEEYDFRFQSGIARFKKLPHCTVI